MRPVWVDSISVVMVVSIVFRDTKANPLAATLRRRRIGQAMGGFGWGRVRKTTAPWGSWLPGAAGQSPYSARGLISAIAFRWRTNFGSFG